MKTVRPIPSITVTFENEKPVEVLRQEMLNHPAMGDLLTNYERLLNEIAELEYETAKLYHARNSMQVTLQNKAAQYVQEKNNPKPSEEKKDED